MRSPVLRPAVLADLVGCADLMNRNYKRRKTPEYLRWQFFDSPFPSVLYCAFLDNRPVGIFGLQQKELVGTGLKVAQAIDLLVAPEMRGQGLFSELGRQAEEMLPKVDAFCVFPNSQGRMACEQGLGYTTLFQIETLILETDGNEGGVRDLPGEEVKGANLASLEALSGHAFARPPGFLEWRYARNPEYLYRVVWGKDGAAIVKTFEDPETGKRFGDVVDYTTSALSAVTTATDALIESSHSAVTTWAAPNSPLRAHLLEYGFVPNLKPERYFCISLRSASASTLLENERWRLVPGDTEVY